MKPMTLIFIGSIIAILGGVLSAFGTLKQNKNSSEKSDRIERGVKKGVEIGESTSSNVGELKQKIEDQAITIDKLRTENNLLHEKLSQKSFEIYNNLTGGNGVIFVKTGATGKTNEYDMVCYNSSKYPQHGVIVGILDYSTMVKEGTKDAKNLFTVSNEIHSQIWRSIEIPVLRPYGPFKLLNNIGVNETKSFIVYINNAGNSPNSIIKQRIAFVKNNQFNFICSDAYNSKNEKVYNNFDLLNDPVLIKEAIKNLENIDLKTSLK